MNGAHVRSLLDLMTSAERRRACRDPAAGMTRRRERRGHRIRSASIARAHARLCEISARYQFAARSASGDLRARRELLAGSWLVSFPCSRIRMRGRRVAWDLFANQRAASRLVASNGEARQRQE